MRKGIAVPAVLKLVLFVVAIAVGLSIILMESGLFLQLRDRALDILGKENIIPETELDKIAHASATAIVHSISCVSDPNYICEFNCKEQYERSRQQDENYVELCIQECNRTWDSVDLPTAGNTIQFNFADLEFFHRYEHTETVIGTDLSVAPTGKTDCAEIGVENARLFCETQIHATTPFRNPTIRTVGCVYNSIENEPYKSNIDRYTFTHLNGESRSRTDVFITNIECSGSYALSQDIDGDFERLAIAKATAAGLKCMDETFDSPSPEPIEVTCQITPSLDQHCAVHNFWLPQDIGPDQYEWGDGFGEFMRNELVAAWGDPNYLLYYEAIPDNEVGKWIVDDDLNIWTVMGTEALYVAIPVMGKGVKAGANFLAPAISARIAAGFAKSKTAMNELMSRVTEPVNGYLKDAKNYVVSKSGAVKTRAGDEIFMARMRVQMRMGIPMKEGAVIKNPEKLQMGMRRLYMGEGPFRAFLKEGTQAVFTQKRFLPYLKRDAREFGTMVREAHKVAQRASDDFVKKITSDPSNKYSKLLQDVYGISPSDLNDPIIREKVLKSLDKAYTNDKLVKARVSGKAAASGINNAVAASVKETTGRTVSLRSLKNPENAKALDSLMKEFEQTGALTFRRTSDDLAGLTDEVLDSAGNFKPGALADIQKGMRETLVQNSNDFKIAMGRLERIQDLGLRQRVRSAIWGKTHVVMKELFFGPNPYFRYQVADFVDASFDGFCDAYENQFTYDVPAVIRRNECLGISHLVCSGLIENDLGAPPEEASGCFAIAEMVENTAELSVVMAGGGNGVGRLKDSIQQTNQRLKAANSQFELAEKGAGVGLRSKGGEWVTMQALTSGALVIGSETTQALKSAGLIPVDINDREFDIENPQRSGAFARSLATFGTATATVALPHIADTGSNKFRSAGVNAIGLTRPFWGLTPDYTFDLPQETHKYFIELERDKKDDVVADIPWWRVDKRFVNLINFIDGNQDTTRFFLVAPCYEEQIDVVSGGSIECENIHPEDVEVDESGYDAVREGENTYLIDPETDERSPVGITEGVTQIGSGRRVEFSSILDENGNTLVIKDPSELGEDWDEEYYLDPLTPEWAFTDEETGLPYVHKDMKAIKMCNSVGFWDEATDHVEVIFGGTNEETHAPIPSIRINPLGEGIYDQKLSPELQTGRTKLGAQPSYCYSGKGNWATFLHGVNLGIQLGTGLLDIAANVPPFTPLRLITAPVSWGVGVAGVYADDAIDSSRKWPNH